MHALRPYQQECLEHIRKDYLAGIRQVLCVLATGTGKTLIAAHLPQLLKDILPGRLLFIAHRNELLEQTIEKFHTWAPELKVGLEKAEHRADNDCDVIVACNATIGREGSTRMERFDWNTVSIIVCDEAHRVLGQSFLNVLEDSGVLREDSTKLLVGFTATPRRSNVTREQRKGLTTLDNEDLISLKSVFKKISYSYPIRKAIKENYLVPLKGYRVETATSLDNVKTTAGDFQVDELSQAVNIPDRNLLAVKAWKEHAEGRQTAAFTCDIRHAKDMAEVFASQGIVAKAIWGEDADRNEKLKLFNAGSITVLANCALLTEGWDSPGVSCILQARPTKSSTLFTQIVGRGTRLYPGKEDCVVLDLVDNYKRNSLVTLPSLLGLNPNFNLHGESATKAAAQIEELQEKHPGVDFTNLTDLSKIKAYVESVDLLSDPCPVEIKELSTLTWQRDQSGSYFIAIPEKREVSQEKQFWLYKHERLVIAQNELEEYVLSIVSTDEERELGIFKSLQEAFTTSDEVLHRCRPDRIKLMQREAVWHNNSASDSSKRYIKKLLGKKRAFGYCVCPVGVQCSGKAGDICGLCSKPQLTAGQASIVLTKLKNKN